MKIKLTALIAAISVFAAASAQAAPPPPMGGGHGGLGGPPPAIGHGGPDGPPPIAGRIGPGGPQHFGGPGMMPPPPPRPRHYYNSGWYGDSDWGWYGGGFGVGILLGTLLNNQAQAQAEADAQARQQAYDKKVAEVTSAALNTATTQSAHIVQILSQVGAERALQDLNQYWHAQGQATFLDARQPISVLKVAGFDQNMTLTYTVDSQLNSATVTVTAPQYNVMQSSTAPFTPPSPVLPPDAAKVLGFTVNDAERSPEGFLIIKNVAPATAAAYIGMKSGAVLYKVDGNSTAQVTVAQLYAYIRGRAEKGAVAALTFSDGGKQKTGNIKL